MLGRLRGRDWIMANERARRRAVCHPFEARAPKEAAYPGFRRVTPDLLQWIEHQAPVPWHVDYLQSGSLRRRGPYGCIGRSGQPRLIGAQQPEEYRQVADQIQRHQISGYEKPGQSSHQGAARLLVDEAGRGPCGRSCAEDYGRNEIGDTDTIPYENPGAPTAQSTLYGECQRQ